MVFLSPEFGHRRRVVEDCSPPPRYVTPSGIRTRTSYLPSMKLFKRETAANNREQTCFSYPLHPLCLGLRLLFLRKGNNCEVPTLPQESGSGLLSVSDLVDISVRPDGLKV